MADTAFRRAADQGDARAMYSLGVLLWGRRDEASVAEAEGGGGAPPTRATPSP